MSSPPRNQTANISQRVENLSRQRANDLSALKAHLRNDLDYLQNEVSTQVSAKLTLNRRQVLHAITDLNTALKQRLGEALFAIFASFNDSLKESDFESLDISRWVNSSLTLFEDRLGTLPLNQDRVLEVINEFTSTWADKVDNIKNTSVSKFSNQPEPSLSGHPSIPSRQTGGDINRGREASFGQDSRDVSDISPSRTDRDDKDKRGPSPSASESKGLFKKMKGLFKAEKSQAGSEGPTNINLGNEKNFTWDPVKKRYIFAGEEEEEEPEDEGPPPMGMGASQQPKKAPADVDDAKHSLVKPPENKLLARKKAPSSKSQPEGKKPAFMPSKFVPRAEPEESKEYESEHIGQDILEDIKRRVDEIFERTMGQEVLFEGIEKMKRDLKILDELSLPQLNDEILREAKLLALESEIESTQVSFVKETYNRKALESELSSLRESFQQNFEKQYALDNHVKELERDLSMYKDLYSAKSTTNGNQSQQKNIESYLKSLKDSSTDKKKLFDTGSQIRGVELQLQEAKASIKVSEGRYEQVIDYLNKENNAVAQLRGLLEDSYKTQKEQDQIIVELKKENLSLVSKYRGVYSEAVASQREKESLRSHLNNLEESLNSRVGTITELEGKLTQVNERVKGQENQSQKKERELRDHLKKLEDLNRDKENLERKLQDEEQQRLYLEQRLEELEVYREQLEARIQEEEAIRRQLEEQIREDEVFKARIRQENQEFARRVDDLIFEKENYERRLEETAEGEKRMRIQIDDYQRQVDEYQRHLNQIIEQRDQLEIDNRKEREKMLEELMENKSVSQVTSQEKEILNKFSEEITSRNLNLEQNMQILSVEVNKLRSEKQRSIETILDFIREIRMTASAENQELDSLENYIIEILESSEEISEKHFKAIGILPKIREAILREAEVENTRKDLQSDELVTRLNTLEKERGLYDEQSRLYEADISRMKEIIDVNREQTQQLEQKLDLLANEGEQIKRENEEYVHKNYELERALHDKDVYLKDTVQAFTENQQYQAQIMQDLEYKFQQLASLKERAEKIQDELETEKGRNSHISGVQAELEDVINRLKDENVDLQQQLDEGFEQYTFLQGKTKDLLDQFKQTKEENSQLTQELEQLKQENETLKQSDSNLEQQNQTLAIEKENLMNELNEINQRFRDLETDLNQKNTQISILEERVTLAEKSQSPLIKSANNEFIARLEDMTRIINEKDHQIRELTQEGEGRNELLSKVEVMQQIIDERQNIITELNEKLQTQSQEMERLVQDREIIIKGLEERIALQENMQAGNVDNNDLLNRIEEMTRLLEAKEGDIKGLESLNEETLVSLRALEEEREQALRSLQQITAERDEAVANFKEIQAEQTSMIERLALMQRERDNLVLQLEQEEAKTAQIPQQPTVTGGVPEEIVQELEARIQALEEERINLYEDREGVIRDRDNLLLAVERLEADLAERVERTSGLPEGEELWNEIEGEYRGSKVMDYLDSMKSKLQIQRGLSAGKLVQLMLKEFEEAIGELSKELEEKETTLIGLSRSLEEMNEQNQKLQNNNDVLEGEQSEKEDYSSIRELYEKKTKRVEELLKEVNAKNSQIEQLQKKIEDQGHEVGEKGHDGDKNDFKEENTLLRQEIAKEKERCLKVTEEYDNYKKKYKNNDEERGAIQHSYSQIIKNLSLQLDEMKKKKGISTAITVSKGIQTGEEETSKKSAIEEDPYQSGPPGKKSGFLSGMAKFFLTESEVKKI